jgi:UPF0755 protein
MTQGPMSPGERNERRNTRIRQLREQREAPIRRRKSFQPVVLLAWFAGVAVLAAIVIFLGFLAFAPRLLAWVEDNPGWIEQGVVRDFVRWYKPDELKDAPASANRQRITVEVQPGITDSQIGDILLEKGVIKSQLAFQYAVLNAGRSGTLAAGIYDLSPTMRPSQIVAALRQFAAPEVTVRLGEGWRLEQIVAELAKSDLTMNIDEFVKLVKTPPADLLKQYDFFADLPVGRTLEGYLPPNTYRIDGNAKAIDVLKVFLDEFNKNLTAEIRDQLASRGKTVDYAVTLASIVEREAVLEKERPLIAGVYTNRLDNPDNAETSGLLNADPTLQWALATATFSTMPVGQWGSIDWWPPLQVGGADVQLPAALSGYQTYVHPGLPPGPIAAPRVSSIRAAAFPDTAAGYLYFTAGCPSGVRDGSHYFATTNAQQEANSAKANGECPAP